MADHYLEKDDGKASETEIAGALPSQPQYVLDHEAAFTTIENDIRHEIIEGRINDPNLDPELLHEADQALAKGDEKAELRLEDVIADDSIYPEVRAAVSNVDDPSMPVNTFRSWFLGMLATTVFSGVNAYFSPGWPVISLPAVVAQILALPLGNAMAMIPYPSNWPLAWFFNPGPFNIKEHSLITIMATVSSGTAYTTDIFIASHAYYHQHNLSAGYMILLTLSTQLIGFSFAGFCRQVLVWPASMIWPSNLQTTALMNALHEKDQLKFKGWTRQKVFYVSTIATFAWEWLPQYLFTSLSYFSWPAWIAPNNKGVNMVFGGTGGLGLGFICFDWNQISYIGSPLYTPWHAAVCTFMAFLVAICFVAPILWATNYKNMGYLTFLSSGTYDRFGQPYNTAYIVTDTLEFDEEKYMTYSAQYMPSSFIISYTLGFGAITAALSHAICFYGKDIVRQFRQSLHEEPDIHARLMSRYKEVPHWWYVCVFLASFAMAVPAIKVYHTELPVWMLIVGLLIPAVYMLPLGVVQGVTSIQIGLNVISEMISGYALPGRPIAMMIFKTFGYITMSQGLSFVQDLKFGHYMKVPPRDMFWSQMIATIWGSLVQVGVTAYLFGTVQNMCQVDPNQPVNPPRYTCAQQHTFYSASVIYGLISPYRTFAAGAPWAWSNIAFLVGAVVPIPTWLLARRFPNSWVRLINWPVAFNATGYIPPAGGINITSWFLVCFIFQYFLRRHYFAFWSHSNYILSAGFSAGAAVAGIIITACLQIPSASVLRENPFNGDNQWWGNTIEGNTLQGGTFAANSFDVNRGFAPAPNGQWLPNPVPASS